MLRSQNGALRCLALAAALGCGAPRAREAPVSNTAGAAAAPRAEPDTLAAAVLDRFVADPETLPDAGLLPKAGPLYVLLEVGREPEQTLRLGALPRARRPYVGKTLAELQAEADERGHEVAFIRFFAMQIEGERAAVTSGVDLVLPTQQGAAMLCCCMAEDRYEKRAGRWTFVKRGLQICS